MNIPVFYSPICSGYPEAIKVGRETVEGHGLYGLKVKSTLSIFINQTNILSVPIKERLKIALEKELAR